MSILFLAHGAWGIWDEVLPILLVVGFVLIFVGAAVISRLRDTSSSDEPEQPAPSNEPASQSTDHYRLD